MKEEIIIDIQINEVAAKLAANTSEIERLKKANKDLDKTTTEGAKAFAKNAGQIKNLTSENKILTNQIQATQKEYKSLNDSIFAQEAHLTKLKNQYKSLSTEMQKTAGGVQLKKQIDDLDSSVKESKASLGEFQMNVGNYPELFDLAGTSIGRLQGVISQFSKGATSAGQVAGNAFSAIKAQAISLGKAFLTPPIGLIVVVLSAIMLAVKSLVEAFKRNDEAATRLEKAFAALAPEGEAIAWVFDKVALHISKIIEGFAKGYTAAVKIAEALHLLPKGYADAAKSAADLVQAQDDLEEAERKYTVNSANRNKQIADLQAKSLQDSKYSAEQRKKFLQDAMDLEKQDMQENVKNQKQKLANLQALANKRKDTSDATANAIAAQEAAVINAEAAEDEGNRRRISKIESINREIESFNREIEAKNKARLAEQQKTKENSLKIYQELEDIIIRTTKEGVEKEIAEKRKATDRKIAELKKETNLTAKGIENRNLLIKKLNEETEKEAEELRKKASEEKIKADIETETKRLQILVEGATKGSKEEYDLKVKALHRQRDLELKEKTLTEEEKEAISKKYLNQETELKYQQIREEQTLIKQAVLNDFERQKLDAYNNSEELARIEVEQAEKEYNTLLALDEAQKIALYDNQENYEAQVIASEKRIRDAKAKTMSEEEDNFIKQVNSIGKISDSFSKLFTAIAEDQEEMQEYTKLIALANIATSLAQGIAGVVTSAAKGGNVWEMIAEIAAGVASVTATIIEAKTAMNDAKTPSAPSFTEGGIVPGTSYTGDNVQALVNSGEMILNREQQANLFKSLNNTQTATGIDYEMLASAMSNIKPQVAVTEINNVNNRVNVLENLSYL